LQTVWAASTKKNATKQAKHPKKFERHLIHCSMCITAIET